jgi:hypothetical protein
VAHPQIAAFARLANGAANPTRAIAGQNTLFTRTIHDMAYDPGRDEIVVPAFYAFAILTFRGDANGNAAPIRKIMGGHTKLLNTEGLTLDPIHGEIFVPQGNRVLVFRQDADGDVSPIRILEGPSTQLNTRRLTVDPINNVLIASGGNGLRIYDRTASGNAMPRGVISGPNSLASGASKLTNYPPKGWILAGVKMGGRHDAQDFVGVWSIHDNGDVAPRWTVGGPNGLLGDVRGVAVDAKNKSLIVADKTLNAVLTFHVPEIF